jgi:hypothetical protein
MPVGMPVGAGRDRAPSWGADVNRESFFPVNSFDTADRFSCESGSVPLSARDSIADGSKRSGFVNSDPFDGPGGRFHVVVNDEQRHSLWPTHAAGQRTNSPPHSPEGMRGAGPAAA